MKQIFILKKILKGFFFSFIFFFFLIFQSNFQVVNALPMDNYQSELVVEELRLRIPNEFKDEWLKAEKTIWEPWLSKKDGYLGRQIFWNKDKEEALILVNWKNKKLWKSISMKEVNEVQKIFDEKIKSSLKLNVNPFKLITEGELYKEG